MKKFQVWCKKFTFFGDLCAKILHFVWKIFSQILPVEIFTSHFINLGGFQQQKKALWIIFYYYGGNRDWQTLKKILSFFILKWVKRDWNHQRRQEKEKGSCYGCCTFASNLQWQLHLGDFHCVSFQRKVKFISIKSQLLLKPQNFNPTNQEGHH